jgi:hypothetical protein
VLVLIALGGLLLLPEVLRWAAVRRLQARITAPVQIKDVDLNVFTGRARVSNLVIGEGGSRPILKLPKLDLRFSRRALLWGQVVLRGLVFHQPQLFIERTGSGRLKVHEVVRPDQPTGVWPITLEAGSVELRNLTLWFPDGQEPLFSTERLSIEIPRINLPSTLRADVEQVRLVGATFRLKRERGGKFTLQRLWSPPEQQRRPQAPHTDAPPSPQGALSASVIRRLDVVKGRIEFVDETVTPTFTGEISQLTGEVRYEPEQTDRASLTFRGTLARSVPLELRGWFTISEGPMRLSLEATLRDYELSQVNTYAEKYVRYQIRRGRVTVEGSYSYDAGQLDTESEVALRHVELGEQLGDEFRERVGVPLKLVLALLEDADGEVRLNMPVSGNVNNPEFSIGSAAWKSVQAAVLKALTAPFKLLGTILTVGGKIGEVRIDPVTFLPGTIEPDPASKDRLAKLVDFLKSKPRVRLELRGLANRQEVEALKRRQLRERIEAAKDRTYADGLRRLFQAATGEESPMVSATMMENYLLQRIAVTEVDLDKLAEDRERVIEQTMVREGVDAGRLFVVSKEKGAVTDAPPGRVEIEILD